MTSPHTASTARLIIRGTDAGAFTVVAIWVVASLLLASFNRLAWTIFAFLSISGIVLFLFLGWYQRSKEIALFSDHVDLMSWFGQQRIPLDALTSFSLHTTLSARSLKHTIVCWGQAEQELGEIPVVPFPKDQLAQLLSTIQSDHPTTTIDRELEKFLRGR